MACNSESSNNDSENQDKDSVVTAVENQVSDTLKQADTSAVEDTGTTELSEEYTAKYICPNHDKGSGSDKPGDCPVCGMELIENPNYQGN